ncbi:MAG: DUF4038 domain-containing protein [Actinobacteria bacterium]|uniref:Unannotated protein n=1 Tax=freshwater metagenome TaxID=449393 RepID=A0A6J6HYC0_9ZZZZ|nr:DUF4038 domain-containing protein [Actinomycetota bacterium]
MLHTWQYFEISFEAAAQYSNPYTEVALEVVFLSPDGRPYSRPAFWNGSNSFKVRFAAPLPGRWSWTSKHQDPGLTGNGEFLVLENQSANKFFSHGFLKMSPQGRSIVHADGEPFLIAADTAWALPWRATTEDAKTYAVDRASKGFNAALLMTVQPDMDARGPRERNLDEGFAIAFEDLQDGHLTKLNPEFFDYFDKLHEILIEHEIVPILQPVFQGFGWKGLRAAGKVVSPTDYARYCRYLVARYGASPAIYLPGADGIGEYEQISAGGKEIESVDCYQQPTGIHYQPHTRANSHQSENWLDFQWCQTGHGGDHAPQRVAEMWLATPAKGVANAEPSYENNEVPGRASGWWQGTEAWVNLAAGGTMGVFYGAASLWQWRLHKGEPGHAIGFINPDSGWREALDYEGSTYVGLVAKILAGLPTTDMQPSVEHAISPHCLIVPGKLFIAYQEQGGRLMIMDDAIGPNYRVVDPQTGVKVDEGVRPEPDPADQTSRWIEHQAGQPRVYICWF